MKAKKIVTVFTIAVMGWGNSVFAAPALISYTPDPTNDFTPTLQWNTVSGATQYQIQIANNPGFSPTIANQLLSAATSYTHGSDLPLGDIYWKVSDDFYGLSNYSSADYFVITGAPLLIPFSPDPTPDLTPTLYWNSLSGASNYRVRVDDNTGFSSPIEHTTMSGATSYTAPTLWQGNVYWKVSSDKDGYVEYCPADQFVISTAPALIAYTPDPTPDFTPTWYWNPVSGASEYKVEWADNVGFASPASAFVSGAVSYSASLPDDGLWYWHVSSDLDYGVFSPSDNFTVQKPIFNPYPQDTTIDQTPTFTWNDYPGATTYKIEIADNVAFNTPLADFVSNSTSYTPMSNLSQGTTYWHFSTNHDYTGFSDIDSFVIDINQYPEPIPFSPETVTTLQPLFQWNPVSGASTYTLHVDNDPAFNSLDINETSGATSYSSPSNMAQGTFYWKLSSSLKPNSFCPYEIVTICTAPHINEHTPDPTPKLNPTLTWNAVSGATGYNIEIADNLSFNTPITAYISGATSYPASLPYEGPWYWHVSSDIDAAYFSNTDDFTYQKPQINRFDGSAVHTNYPNLTWSSYPNASDYYIRIDDNISFASPAYTQYTSGATSYDSPYLSSATTYYWCVSTDIDYNAYSEIDTFRVTQGPELVTYGGDSTTELRPTFRWHPVSGASWYTIQIQDDISFSGSEYGSSPNDTFYIPSEDLPLGTIYWRVSCDLSSSDYSDPDSIKIIDTVSCWHVSTTGDSTNSGTAAYPLDSINHALDHAGPGDTIKIAQGTYLLNNGFNIEECGIILLGGYSDDFTVRNSDSLVTSIDGQNNSYSISIFTDSDTVGIDGITFQNSSMYFIYVMYADYLSVTNCRFINCYEGIEFHEGNYGKVMNNIFAFDSIGVLIDYSKGIEVINNTFVKNGIGVKSYAGSDSIIAINNIFAYNNRGFRRYSSAFQYADTVSYNAFFANDSDYVDSANTLYTGTAMNSDPHNSNNIAQDPVFKDTAYATYDFHLSLGSQCVDAGDTLFPYANEPAPNGSRINLGAYGNTQWATISGTAPSITTHPASDTSEVGESQTFSVSASGTAPLSYQWYNEEGVPIANATAAVYTINPVSLSDSGNYTVMVSNTYGAASSLTAKLFVPIPLTITSQPTDSTVAIDDPVRLSVVAAGHVPFFYWWIKDGTDTVGYASNFDKDTAAVSDSGNYNCVVYNEFDTITSTIAKISVTVPPIAITTQPSDSTVLLNASVGLSIAATGYAPLSYVWIKDTTDTVGGTANSYFVDSVALTDEAIYHCVVYNPYDTVNSDTVKIFVEESPVADFAANQATGIDTLTVAFYDSSKGDVDRWVWDFGDGTIDTFTVKTNPVHFYNTPGAYSVSLKVTNTTFSLDSTVTKANYISVYQQSVSTFTGMPRTGVDSVTVTFTLDSVSTGVSQWIWDYGDGVLDTFYTATNPSYYYGNPGIYSVKLKVSGSGGVDSTVRAGYISVYNHVTASFRTTDSIGIAPFSVQFYDSSTGDFNRWLWDFGNGTTDSTQHPSFTYTTKGTYSPKLVVSGLGGVDSMTLTNHIIVYEPAVAKFSVSDTDGIAPLQVQFFDSSTGDISTRLWNFGDGGSDTAKNPAHTYTTPGTYAVSLTVSGNGGTDTLVKTNFMNIYEPAVANFSASDTVGQAPLSVTFYDSSTGDVDAWYWEFGDGNTGSVKVPVHEYTTRGTFDVKLVVSGKGGTDTLTKPEYITVLNSPPVLTLPLTDTLFEDSAEVITAAVTDANNDAVTLSFISGAPTDMEIDQSAHTLKWIPDNDDVGEYTIAVLADDNYGGKDTATITVTVLNTNDFPVIDSIMFPDTSWEDSLMTAKVVVSDPDILDSVELSLSSNATWLSITKQPLTRGGNWLFDIQGTPGDADTGLFEIIATATDRDSLSTDTVQIVFIVNTNDPPDTKLSKKDVLYGAVKYVVSAADDFDSVFTFTTQFNGGGVRYDTTVSNTTGTFSFYPLVDGTYIFSCKAEDQDGLEDPTPYVDTIVISGVSAHTWSDTGIWDMLSVPSASYSAATVKTAGKVLHWDESQEPNGIYKYYIRSSGITDLTAGNAYWIKLDTTVAVTLTQNELSTGDSLVIKLSKAEFGWNQISSPYLYPVKWNSTLTLWEWDATNRDFVESDGVLYPWDGYWVLAESATPVTVNADPLYVGKALSRRSRTLFVDKTEWTFKITLKSNINHDADNLFGISKYARNGYDALDRPEPPRMGDEPYLFFAHPEWKRSVNQFASDIRRTWDSKVNIFQLGISPCAKDVTALMFTISGYDEDTPIYLFVNTLPEMKQYKPGTAVTIKPSDAVQYRTVFATTDKDFLNKFPFTFALNHPYPNPCRQRATIKYTLPYRWESNGWLDTKPYKVKMVIYDARGRVIRELVNRKQGPGHYRIIWRGKSNTGHMVASGFYFIRIVAGKYSSVKKIITLR